MRAVEGGSELLVRARPRASHSEILGVRSLGDGPHAGDALDVRLAAPPVDGAANAELLDLLARALDVPQRDLVLVQGASGRTKRVNIRGLRPDQVLARLALNDG